MEGLACFNSFTSGVIHILALTIMAGATGYLQGVDRARKQTGKDYILIPKICLLYTSPSPRDVEESRMPSSA